MAAWDTTRAHWDSVYGTRGATEVSWYEARPAQSLDLIRAAGVRSTDPIIDVGGGASRLADELLAVGHRDITVLDVSAAALNGVRARLGPRARDIAFIDTDVRSFAPARRYALWHDRAVFHFLVDRHDRTRYVDALRAALADDGQSIIATFGPAGPERCSGLPVRRYDPAALARELGADFRLAESALVTHRTPKAAEQQFLYCRFERAAAP